MSLFSFDPDIATLLQKEKIRQQDHLEMIPSENFVSENVLTALGSIATNKYAEGYPGKRYYGGCEFIDGIEQLAIDRAKQLFGAEHVNVQPLSGAPANTAVYFALLQPGDTILGLDLAHGGHLTHGHPVTHTAKLFNFVRYHTKRDTAEIDYEEVRALALQHKPKLLLCGYSAYTKDLDYAQFRAIADEVGAILMADVAHIAGLIAAQEMNNPVPYCDIVTTTTHKTLRGPRGGMIMCKQKFAAQIDKSVFPSFQGGPHENGIAALAVALKEALQPEFKIYARQIKINAQTLAESLISLGHKLVGGGTENHLLLIDVTPLGLNGAAAQIALDKAGITTNKNAIPFDERPPLDPSGIRLGTPALTTRGMKEEEMKQIAIWIDSALKNHNDDEKLAEIRSEVTKLCANFPLYQTISYDTH